MMKTVIIFKIGQYKLYSKKKEKNKKLILFFNSYGFDDGSLKVSDCCLKLA